MAKFVIMSSDTMLGDYYTGTWYIYQGERYGNFCRNYRREAAKVYKTKAGANRAVEMLEGFANTYDGELTVVDITDFKEW